MRYNWGEVESKEIKNGYCKIPLLLALEREKRLTHEKDINQHNPDAMDNGKMKTIKIFEQCVFEKWNPQKRLEQWVFEEWRLDYRTWDLVLGRFQVIGIWIGGLELGNKVTK